MRDFEDIMRRFNIYLVGIFEGKEEESKLEEIMVEKFLELLEDIVL